MTDAERTDQFTQEQAVVDRLYARLDTLRETTAADLAAVRRSSVAGTHQGRSERDAFAQLYEDHLQQLWNVEDRLVFGRLDATNQDPMYVGRLGMTEGADRLMVDWRAPVARVFYAATAVHPEGIARRRHITVRDRDVVALEDDVLDMAAVDAMGLTGLQGEGALLAAVSANRTGRMGDIVATIQAEQDQVIRDDLSGVMVVQGGPGTGKTAVALHRAAYLLYNHREQLAKSAVLVIGPSRAFMRYIEHVLPSLGETGTVMMTLGELLPGVTAVTHDVDDTAAMKGDLRMVPVLRNAVARYSAMPHRTVEVAYEAVRLALTPQFLAGTKKMAFAAHSQHNAARPVFLKAVIAHLADQYCQKKDMLLEPAERAELRDELRQDPLLVAQLNRLWLPLTPQLVLSGLFALPRRLDAAAPKLTEHEKMSLWRDHGAPWTVQDVPLLDELAELVGPVVDDLAGKATSAEEQYAADVLEMLDADGLVSAQQLAQRFSGEPDLGTVADRAMMDRTWAYGHVVVDEAQELSAMAWRAVRRRVPTGSMTIVGDLAQTRAASPPTSWQKSLVHITDKPIRVHELTVNYRSPRKLIQRADEFAAAHNLPVTPATTVRDGDENPWFYEVTYVPRTVTEVLRMVLATKPGARIGVLTSTGAAEKFMYDVRRGLRKRPVTIGEGPLAVDDDIAVMTAAESKGLEFDVVVLVEPTDILQEVAGGAADVYVALTRATQAMHVIYSKPLPPGIGRI